MFINALFIANCGWFIFTRIEVLKFLWIDKRKRKYNWCIAIIVSGVTGVCKSKGFKCLKNLNSQGPTIKQQGCK